MLCGLAKLLERVGACIKSCHPTCEVNVQDDKKECALRDSKTPRVFANTVHAALCANFSLQQSFNTHLFSELVHLPWRSTQTYGTLSDMCVANLQYCFATLP